MSISRMKCGEDEKQNRQKITKKRVIHSLCTKTILGRCIWPSLPLRYKSQLNVLRLYTESDLLTRHKAAADAVTTAAAASNFDVFRAGRTCPKGIRYDLRAQRNCHDGRVVCGITDKCVKFDCGNVRWPWCWWLHSELGWRSICHALHNMKQETNKVFIPKTVLFTVDLHSINGIM